MRYIPKNQIKDRVTLASLLIEFGWPEPSAENIYRSKCLFHNGDNPTEFSADLQKNTWHCFSCGRCGDQIEFVMETRKCDFPAALEWLANRDMTEGLQRAGKQDQQGEEQGGDIKRIAEDKSSRQLVTGPKPGKRYIVARYDYRDEMGHTLYQVVRYEPKAFRMRHKNANGRYVWNMKGVRRVLYNLPEVIKADQIWVVEGEADADSLMALGHIATCNLGGACNWKDHDTEPLDGKEVIICPDNDEPGERHCQMVLNALLGKAKSIRVVRLPQPCKDIRDYINEAGPLAEMKVTDLLRANAKEV